MTQKKTPGSSSIRKSLAVLDAFTMEHPQRTLSEIAHILEAPLPTASRIVTALCEEGFLEKDDDKIYHLGWKCCRMGTIFEASNSIVRRAFPHMKRLRDHCNETVSLYLRRGIYRICCSQIASTHALQRFATPGELYPLWAGATGKCFLAFMTDQELLEVKAAAPEKFQLRWEKLMAQSRAVLTNGYATSVAEREPGISSVSCPVFDFRKRPVACISISGPSFRFTDELTAQIVVSGLAETKELSLSLGAPHSLVDFPTPRDIPHLQGD